MMHVSLQVFVENYVTNSTHVAFMVYVEALNYEKVS